MPRLYRCVRLAQVRHGPALDSSPCGTLAIGVEIVALDARVDDSSGVERVFFDAGAPVGWVSRTISGKGRIARSIPILQDLGELDALLGAAAEDSRRQTAGLSLKERMTLQMLTSGEVAHTAVEETAEAAARLELKALAARGVAEVEGALAARRAEDRCKTGLDLAAEDEEAVVYMSIDDHQVQARSDREEGYQFSDEEHDLLGGFDSSSDDEDDRQTMCSSGTASMRMSMAFTPSRSGSRSLLIDDGDDDDCGALCSLFARVHLTFRSLSARLLVTGLRS